MKEKLVERMEEALRDIRSVSIPCFYTLYLGDKELHYIPELEEDFASTAKNMEEFFRFGFDMIVFAGLGEASKGEKRKRVIVVFGMDRESGYRVLKFYDMEGRLIGLLENEDVDVFVSAYLLANNDNNL
ncbi:MAG: hypothetical protein QW734_07115 [Candidatus Bathyarchaeia archaeon]